MQVEKKLNLYVFEWMWTILHTLTYSDFFLLIFPWNLIQNSFHFNAPLVFLVGLFAFQNEEIIRLMNMMRVRRAVRLDGLKDLYRVHLDRLITIFLFFMIYIFNYDYGIWIFRSDALWRNGCSWINDWEWADGNSFDYLFRRNRSKNSCMYFITYLLHLCVLLLMRFDRLLDVF